LNYSGEVNYKDGNAYKGETDYQEANLTLYSAFIQGNFQKEAFVRAGRFLPAEIYSFGYLEGVQYQRRLGKKFKVGAVGGYKPDPFNLNSNSEQPTTTQYLSMELGQRRSLYLTSLVGIHHTLFKGKLDRRTVLLDQQLGFSSKINLQALAEIDFDVHHSTRSDSGMLLSRLNLLANLYPFRFFSLRGGMERSQRPDTLAERNLFGGPVSDDIFNQIFERYWGGATINLPFNFSSDGDLSYYKETNGNLSPPHWRGTLTRRGLPFLPFGSLSASAYNIVENDVDFLGGVSTVYVPIADGRFNIFGSYGTRQFSKPDFSKEWQSTDYSVQLDWRVSKKISIRGGLTHTFPVYLESDLFDATVEYRW
jgi:hypothetical protein